VEEDRVAEACIGYRRDIGPADDTNVARRRASKREMCRYSALYDQANAVYGYIWDLRQMLEKLSS
jgi:hypothetical protein